MAIDKVTGKTLPSASDLYTDRPPEKTHWYNRFVETPTRITMTAIATAGIIAAAATSPIWAPAVASKFDARTSAPPVTYNPPAQTQPIDQNALYRSNAQTAILLSVPELANYKSALDYTTQRLTDMKNVYNIQLDQAIVPVSKWVKANIDWDKKGERLVSFNENIDFMPDRLFYGNYTIITNGTKGGGSNEAAFALRVDEMVNEHNQIWADIHDPKKLEQYLDWADKVVPLPFTEEFAKPYKLAIREHGTYADKAHWALVGKGMAVRFAEANEELIRNEVPQAMILAVGGKAQIAHNIQYFPDTSRKYYGDRQLAIAISPELESYFNGHPEIFGTPIDRGYLQPNLPSMETVKNVGKIPSVVLLYREGPGSKIGEANRTYLVGDVIKANQVDR